MTMAIIAIKFCVIGVLSVVLHSQAIMASDAEMSFCSKMSRTNVELQSQLDISRGLNIQKDAHVMRSKKKLRVMQSEQKVKAMQSSQSNVRQLCVVFVCVCVKEPNTKVYP